MAKIIRPTYPLNFSIGLLVLVFLLSAFVSFEIFDTSWRVIMSGDGPLLGMALCGIAIVVTVLILWEEFLFPVRIKPLDNEIIFRNHFTKLKTQVLFYCAIPAIVMVVYLRYDVSPLPFVIWSVACIIAPAGKLISGLKNYNDFLKFTNDTIEFKNNENEAVLRVTDIREIILIKDEGNVLHKIKVIMSNEVEVMIDLDEMELDAYLRTIDVFIKVHYNTIVK